MTEHPIHRSCDVASEVLILFMLVFSPWAFGTTQPWSIWTMNICGYLLGFLWINKLVCRRMLSGHWSIPDAPSQTRSLPDHDPHTDDQAVQTRIGSMRTFLGPRWIPALAVLTVALLAYLLVAALNVRAVYNWNDQTFEYRERFISWLPMTYDGPSSIQMFWNALALACVFWAVMDWMRLGALESQLSGPRFRRYHDEGDEGDDVREAWMEGPPERLRRLLWTLALHGAVLTAVCMIQRADGGAKLLWVMETRINQDAAAQFGPYAYRSNAAQYLNLLWPVVLGFWWWLDRSTPRGYRYQRLRSMQHMLLPVAALIAVGPIISLSRAGALVGVSTCLVASGLLLSSGRSRQWKFRSTVALIVGAVIAVALYINGDRLLKRFETSKADFLQGREVTYELARKMAEDYPVYGTGPGTFDSVFSMYRNTHEDYWPSQLHNDWLEFRITLGWVGMLMLCGLMLFAMSHPPVGRSGVRTPWVMIALLWLGLLGCLVHARADFPFQIYSIQLMAITLCAMLTSMRWRRNWE